MRQNNHIVEVQKTDKIDIDKDIHFLPPGNELMEEFKVADYFCPDEWSKNGVFIAIKEGEPLWFDLRGNGDCACLPSVQRLNPITGEPANLEAGLSKDPKQNYMTLPGQQWLDGYASDGKVYQFVITKAGEGLAVNEFVLPKHMQDSHAVGFAFFDPKNSKPVTARRRSATYFPQEVFPEEFMKSVAPRTFGAGAGAGADPIWSSGTTSIDTAIGANCDDVTMRSTDAFADGPEIEAALFCCSSDPGTKTTTIPAEAETINDPEVVDTLEEREEQDLAKASMGQGGRISQRIVTDENTVDYYHDKPSAVLTIYFALPSVFENIMKKGKRQDETRPDEYKMSGKVGGVQVPLI